MVTKRYWLVRGGTGSVVIRSGRKEVQIESRRTPTMRVGDTLLFLEGSEQMRFTASADIRQIGFSSIERADGFRLTTVELGDVVSLPEEVPLEAFWYSLTVVRNMSKPYLHFRRGYRSLPHEDFVTIQKGEPFVARSGYFELLNALPPSLRADFEAEQIRSRIARSDVRTTYLSRLKALYAFIDKRVLAVGRLLVDLNAAIAEADIQGEQMDHVFAVDDDSTAGGSASNADSLALQLRRFEGLEKALRVSSTSDGESSERGDQVRTILRQLVDSDKRRTEDRFENLFRLRND